MTPPLVEHTHSRRECGFTLIEMLVTVVVLSIGLLGLAGLQASGLRNNHSAYLRTQATFLAMEIADRMRANRDAAVNGSYDLLRSADPASGTSIAANDLITWINDLENRLPSGDGAISRNGDLFTITVFWNDTRYTGSELDANLTSFAMQTEL